MLDNNSIDKLNKLYDDFRILDTCDSSWYCSPNSKIGNVLNCMDEEDVFDKLDYEVHPELLENNTKHDLLYEFIKSIKKSLVVIDKDISYAIYRLNSNDYITEFSCQGHYEEPEIVTEPYIIFNTTKLSPILKAIKKGNTDVDIHITCIDVYSKTYKVGLYPANYIYIDFLDTHDDKYNEKILIIFKRWIDQSLIPFINFICDSYVKKE